MSARQQLARVLPVALLAVLAIAGLRGIVPAPRWNGPLKAEGVAIGIALEVVLGVLLVNTVRRDRAKRRADALRPLAEVTGEISVPAALRFTIKWLIGLGMIGIAVLLISNLHFHIFIKSRPLRLPVNRQPRPRRTPNVPGNGPPVFAHTGQLLYALLVLLLVAAVAVSIWWASRLRPALPPAPAEEATPDAEELREAVESGRAALAGISDARSAIIACYAAMERSLADRGAARGVAGTPDELLSRAVAAEIVRGPAAWRLTALFYEARFSSHPLGLRERDDAMGALDALAAELGAKVTL